MQRAGHRTVERGAVLSGSVGLAGCGGGSLDVLFHADFAVTVCVHAGKGLGRDAGSFSFYRTYHAILIAIHFGKAAGIHT